MQNEVTRYRFEDSFFVQLPRRGGCEPVKFIVHEANLIGPDGRYQNAFGLNASGQIFFGLDEAKNQMVYHQLPPRANPPVGLFVPVNEAVVYKDWSQHPESGTFGCMQ
jgi:hypothetical protein